MLKCFSTPQTKIVNGELLIQSFPPVLVSTLTQLHQTFENQLSASGVYLINLRLLVCWLIIKSIPKCSEVVKSFLHYRTRKAFFVENPHGEKCKCVWRMELFQSQMVHNVGGIRSQSWVIYVEMRIYLFISVCFIILMTFFCFSARRGVFHAESSRWSNLMESMWYCHVMHITALWDVKKL